ncbi:MAG TPA: hypothetical protein VMW32_12300 [Bacteroidales bacterium]|nr:hypothetical protein [Bacteroidales bacterium]
MELINAFVRSQYFEGEIIKETDKAILIRSDVDNWIPKSVFLSNSIFVGKGLGQDFTKSDLPTIEIDIYDFECPFWLTVKKDPPKYAY